MGLPVIPGYGSFHVAAYSASLGSVTNNDTAPVTDGIILIQNSHLLPQVNTDIMFAWAGGTTLGRARLNSPRIRQTVPAYIRPISLLASPANNDNVMLLQPGDLTVNGLEELVFEATTTGAGPAQTTCVLGLAGTFVPRPSGNIYNVRATGTTTATAHAWTSCALTFDTVPPVGIYAVVGGELISTTCQGWRLTFDGQYYRPGFIGQANDTSRQLYLTYYGRTGVWGYFSTTNLPRLEVLCNAADTAQELYLQCIKVG